MIGNQKGLSIVELMIGLTIGILMLAALTALLVNNTNSRAELDKTMQQIENGRYAMQLVGTELRHAGYYGEGMSVGNAPTALPDPCLTALGDLKAALPVAIQGYSQPAVSPLTCLDSANFKSGTDILVVRRAQTASVPAASLDPASVYLQSLGTQFKMDVGSNDTNFSLLDKSGATAPIHPYTVQIYFVSPCARPAAGVNCTGSADDGGFPRPTLKRLELTAGGWATTTLVEGIDHLALEYGIDNDNDGAPNVFTSAPGTVHNWANVVTVRMHMLARNTRESPEHKDEKTYNLGTVVIGPLNDRYRRHAYSEMVRLMNVSGRREI